MRVLSYTVELDGPEAEAVRELGPDGDIADFAVRAAVYDYGGSVSGTLIIYWRGKRKDGAPHARRTTSYHKLTEAWARRLLPHAPSETVRKLIR